MRLTAQDHQAPLDCLYLAHDLDDAAIWRRVAMLRRGGATVAVCGFRRGTGPLSSQLPGYGPDSVQTLGQTANGKMAQRAWAVLRVGMASVVRWPKSVDLTRRPDVIIARNLEMLVLAVVLHLRHWRVPIVYEVLDIHRMMLGPGRRARALRWLERALIRRCGLILISSPGFEAQYLRPYGVPVPRLRLIENKPLAFSLPETAEDPLPRPARDSGPIVIGWFGILRCAWSLHCLDQLTRAAPGRYQVILRGRPALDVLPDFHAVVAANPDIRFEGAYRWPQDLAAIYATVDFAWLIDRYDAGANSDWLLPNRLYEGGLHGAVPVVLDGTQIAQKLAGLDLGISVPEPSPAAVSASLGTLSAFQIAALRRNVRARPMADWVADDTECAAVVKDLRSLCSATSDTSTSATLQGSVP